MKAKSGFNLREVCGEQIIVADGEENIDFSNIISMNESAAYLWKILQSKDSFTVEDMTQLLLQEYEVEEENGKTRCHYTGSTMGKSWYHYWR